MLNTDNLQNRQPLYDLNRLNYHQIYKLNIPLVILQYRQSKIFRQSISLFISMNFVFSKQKQQYNRKQQNFIPMQKQDLKKYSIKQKIRTINSIPFNDIVQTPVSRRSQSQHRIYIPTNQNYFIQTVDKQIRHEGQILKKIKNKIHNFKQKQSSRQKIKNAFNYSHHCFSNHILPTNRVVKERLIRTATSTPYCDTSDTLGNVSPITASRTINKDKASSFSIDLSKAMLNKQNRTLPSGFVRSSKQSFMQNATLQQLMDGVETNIIDKLYKKQRKSTKLAGKKSTDEFMITGGRPLWSNFESYRSSTPNLGRLVL